MGMYGRTAENKAMRDGVPYEKWSEQVEFFIERLGI
jgi:hypothetical protein